MADDAAQVAFDQFAGDEPSVIFRYWHCLENLDYQLLKVGDGDADAVGRGYVHKVCSSRT